MHSIAAMSTWCPHGVSAQAAANIFNCPRVVQGSVALARPMSASEAMRSVCPTLHNDTQCIHSTNIDLEEEKRETEVYVYFPKTTVARSKNKNTFAH